MESLEFKVVGRRTPPHWFNVYFLPRCDSALPAAVFDALDVRPSRNTWDAAAAARADVASRRVPVWVNVLAAAVFDALPVLDELNTFAAALAALVPVVLAICR